MRSDGGLTPMATFGGARAILSGPAAGVVGYARTTFDPRDGTPVIGFDMGGTSTDVSRFGGHFEHVFRGQHRGGLHPGPPARHQHRGRGGGGPPLLQVRSLRCRSRNPRGLSRDPACYRK
ncbi:5-oxoprolinase-like, partial [Poecile atricapillus]|uniref:5-oxoprolinase-like n=1 Tax=Poecile atricapillus TaxID=48891 RepID=UPI002739A6BD